MVQFPFRSFFTLNQVETQECSLPDEVERGVETPGGKDLRAELVQVTDGAVQSVDSRVVDGKYLGLYFASEWCPSCKSFLPVLIKFYNLVKPEGLIEIIYVSADANKEQFTRSLGKMPWYGLQFRNNADLFNKFNVRTIPAFIIVDDNNTVMTRECSQDLQAAFQPLRDYVDKYEEQSSPC
eukprot:Platyproteum_vivax@DN3938_c0_g1_i2.p1